MADYIEPTQEEFDDAEAVSLDILSTECPNVLTKAGSVVRELIVRPMSYLYAWIKANTEDLRKKTTVSYLMSSQETENSIADDVASNYFVERLAGKRARGVITVTVGASSASLPKHTLFTVGDTSVRTPEYYILTTADVPDQRSDAVYIKILTVTNADASVTYLANIPVEAESEGLVEIPVGTSASLSSVNPFITACELTSPITGGSDTETDAEMMIRCKYATAGAGIGSYNGLRRLLDNSPVTVLGLSVVAGEDMPMFRARYNNTNINPGGFVDCFVKTQFQESVKAVSLDLTSASKVMDPDTGYVTYTFELHDDSVAGFYSVRKIVHSHGTVSSFGVTFGSTSDRMDADGARFSRYQKAVISFTSAYSDITAADVYVSYMPSVQLVDDYLNEDDNRFIGQDVCAKAALPIRLSFACSCEADSELTESETALLKRTVADYVNGLEAGTALLNFSDIDKRCRQALPKARLRLPCNMGVTRYMKDGTIDTYYCTTGVLMVASPVNSGCCNYRLCFFSLTESDIRIEMT